MILSYVLCYKCIKISQVPYTENANWRTSDSYLFVSNLPKFVMRTPDAALLEKQSNFPRYNMKCREKHDTIHEIFRLVSRFPR